MVATVYIESSVISYLTSRPSRDLVTAARQTITAEWWEEKKSNYEVYVSALVEELKMRFHVETQAQQACVYQLSKINQPWTSLKRPRT